MFCLQCGKDIGNINKNRICPYYGKEQYEMPQKIDYVPQKIDYMPPKKKILYDYSEEELLTLGLYPQDENYKMSLISMILGKR